MNVDEETYLAHYGILRRSGRYPWGSGGPAEGGSRNFIGYVDELRKSGMSEVEVAKAFGVTTTELRAAKSVAKNETRQADIGMAQRLKDKGYSNVAIGERMKINESSVRSLLAPGLKDKNDVLQATASMLRNQVAEKKYIDVGSGVENHLGISQTKLNTAVAVLREEGYELRYVKVPQLGTGKFTTLKVLTQPGISYSELHKNRDQIRQINEFSDDGGRSFNGMQPPISISSKRVAVKYAEDGGGAADGVIYVRPGVHDISMGASRYAQVRIAVDGTHYLKGMAMYKDDLPPGVDLQFNTKKSNTGNKLDAMKPLKDDPEDPNPFGATVRQVLGKDGKPTSALNIVGSKEGAGQEGGWDTWSRNLSSQFLSKQSPKLAKAQLGSTFEDKKNTLDEIMKLTNPAVRKKLLESFADDADASAVHLKAAALPRQATKVILPVNGLKETEIYAPTFRNGEKVVLVRHPHGGTFEIPELTVNNRHPEAKKLLGGAEDAVGINSKVAERLSGADFDGDTVIVIPNNSGRVKTAPALAGLKSFDAQSSYPKYEGMKVMTARQKGFEMGDISNLITDMTIKGANGNELARAVRHSMVVIDAEKHELNWKQSALDNGIAQLKTKYQGGPRAGASTLISRASSRLDVPLRKPRSAALGGPIDKATGKKVFENTGESFVNRQGKTVVKTERSTKLAEASDAHKLSSGTKVEEIYADHANSLKDLANVARKAAVNTKTTPYSPSAKVVYKDAVDSLNAKLNLALRNSPKERQAQLVANSILATKRAAKPDMDADTEKKVKSQALTEARIRVGAKKEPISITDREWSAIQAGAISNSRLSQILNHADIDQVRKLATPRVNTVMTSAKTRRATAMLAAGYTQAEVADQLGVAVSTLKSSITREKG